MSLNFANPPGVHPPLGLYSHTVSVPAGTELLFISGQVGVSQDGITPSTMAGQADQVFANIVSLLRSHGLVPGDIIKLTTFMVAGQDGDAVLGPDGGMFPIVAMAALNAAEDLVFEEVQGVEVAAVRGTIAGHAGMAMHGVRRCQEGAGAAATRQAA